MPRNHQMIICKICNNPMSAKAKVCPSCGAKNKKPIYKRGWFIALLVIVVLGAIGSIGDGNKSKGNNVISSGIEWPKETQKATTPGVDKNPPASKPETGGEDLVNGMRREFKEAMDSYESFYDEYCAFMKKYSANPTDLTLLGKYTDMLTKLSDMDEKFEAWENADLNNAELKYYIEVNSRIATKLLEVTG